MTTPELLKNATNERKLAEKLYRIVCREFGENSLISRISLSGLKKTNERELHLINKQHELFLKKIKECEDGR